MARPGADCIKFWNFLSITVFRAFQSLEKLISLSITVFRGLNITKHCKAKNQIFTAPKLAKLEHSSVSWPKLTKHCNAQKNQLFIALKLTKHCHAQKIPKFHGICPRPGHRCKNFGMFGNFWALQCFVNVKVGNFGFFWALQCFVARTSQKTAMLKKINFSQSQSSQNLSIALFRGLNLTKHCNAQKIPKFPTLKLTKHCNAQKI